MITLSNGHKLDFLTGAGAMNFDGRGWPWEWPLRWMNLLDPRLFTIVAKTLLPHKWPGNFRWWKPFDTVKFLSYGGEEVHPLMVLLNPGSIGGALNAVGLRGPGLKRWVEKDYPVIKRCGYNVIVSITGTNGGKGCLEMASQLSKMGIVAIEFNASCPNTDRALLVDSRLVARNCRDIKIAAPNLPLLLKLSPAQPYLEIGKAVEGMVEAISINTIPWEDIFGKARSPLAKYGGGGVSGPLTRSLIRLMIEGLVKATKIPVIGAGVWGYDDIRLLREFGASAISFGTIFLRWPWKPTQYVRKWRREND